MCIIYKIKQKHAKHTDLCRMIKKMEPQNTKKCDKRRNHISSKLHTIYISSNNIRHPVTKTYTTLHPTTLHYTCRHFTFSHLNFTELHFTTLSFGLNTFKFPTIPFHLTSLYFSSLHFQIIFSTLLFLSFHPVYN